MSSLKTIRVEKEVHEEIMKHKRRLGYTLSGMVNAAVKKLIEGREEEVKDIFSLIDYSDNVLKIEKEYEGIEDDGSCYNLRKSIEFKGDVKIMLDKMLVLYGDIEASGNVLSASGLYVKGKIRAKKSVMCNGELYAGSIESEGYLFCNKFRMRN